MMPEQSSLSTGLFYRLSLLQFIQFYIWGTWFVTTGNYLIHQLHFSGKEVGMVYGTTAIAATISPFALGYLADRFFSSRWLLLLLHSLGGVLMFVLSGITDFGLFYVVILAYMLCYLPTFSLVNALSFALITDIKEDFPRIRVWGTIAWILAGIVVSYFQWEEKPTPFVVAAVLSFVQALYCLSMPMPEKPSTISKPTFRLSPEVRTLLSDRSLIVLVAALALICIPSSYYYSFVTTFLEDQSVSFPTAKMALGQVSEIACMLLLPFIFRKVRLKYILFVGLFLWGARYGLFVIGIEYNNPNWYYFCLFLHGPAYVFSMLAAQMYLDMRVPNHLRNTAQGFYSLLTLGIGAFIGVVIAGWTIDFFTVNGIRDWSLIWQIPLWTGLVVSILFLFFFKNSAKV